MNEVHFASKHLGTSSGHAWRICTMQRNTGPDYYWVSNNRHLFLHPDGLSYTSYYAYSSYASAKRAIDNYKAQLRAEAMEKLNPMGDLRISADWWDDRGKSEIGTFVRSLADAV